MFLEGLTTEDVKILDTIWSIDTVEELDRYLLTLDERMLMKTLTLIEMCRLAEADDIVERMDEYPEAELIIKNIMN
jgi:hypothetical protein